MSEIQKIDYAELQKSEAEFYQLMRAEEDRVDQIFEEFEKLELAEKRARKRLQASEKKYDRVIKGTFFVSKKNGDFIHLIDENENKVGILHANAEISKLLRIDDGLDGTFGLRGQYWRVQFLFGLTNAMSDFIPAEPCPLCEFEKELEKGH